MINGGFYYYYYYLGLIGGSQEGRAGERIYNTNEGAYDFSHIIDTFLELEQHKSLRREKEERRAFRHWGIYAGHFFFHVLDTLGNTGQSTKGVT